MKGVSPPTGRKYTDEQIEDLLNTDIAVAKAWVNFDGTDADPDSTKVGYNVALITDNGVGNYSITWSTEFASAAYAVVICVSGSDYYKILAQAKTYLRIEIKTAAGDPYDSDVVNVIAFGTQ